MLDNAVFYKTSHEIRESSHGQQTCCFKLRDLETEKLAESLLSFVIDDGHSFCESNGENSLHAIDILYGNFCYKKDKRKWVGSLQDLKAFVLTEVDEEIAESTTWRSPSGGIRGNLKIKYCRRNVADKKPKHLFRRRKGKGSG